MRTRTIVTMMDTMLRVATLKIAVAVVGDINQDLVVNRNNNNRGNPDRKGAIKMIAKSLMNKKMPIVGN